MAKHRAVIIGAGRIGAGYNWPPHPFVYTHADAYLKLKERVELVGFIEPDMDRAGAANKKYDLPVWNSPVTEAALKMSSPDIVSICVPPDQQRDTLAALEPIRDEIKGVWCEKPWMLSGRGLDPKLKIQVNYIRRFDSLHNEVYGKLKNGDLGKPLSLVVMAKKGTETECHFWDLSRWWGVPLTYVSPEVYDPTNPEVMLRPEYVNTEYELICTRGKVRFFQGGMSATEYRTQESRWFPGAQVPHSVGQIAAKEPKVFMEVALSNLLDAVEGKAELKSPPY